MIFVVLFTRDEMFSLVCENEAERQAWLSTMHMLTKDKLFGKYLL